MTTIRERTLAALRFEDVRPTPYTIWYDLPIRERLNSYYGNTAWEGHIHDHIVRMCVNWEPRYPAGGSRFRDVHGSLFEDGDPLHLVEPALKEPVLKGFRIPSYVPLLHQAVSRPSAGAHVGLPSLSMEDVRQSCHTQGANAVTVVGFGYGLFESAWMIRGYEGFLSDLLLEPSFAHGLLDLLLDRQLEVVDELVQLPCDGIIFQDDYGDQRGVSCGPGLWRTFIKPRLARLYARVQRAGKMTFHHSCGNVLDIIPDLIDIGLDVLQSLQPEAMPVYELKRRYGRLIGLWGGLGTQRLLPLGTPGEIRAEVRRLKRELGMGGGFVLSSAKPIMKEVPTANAVAFLEEVLADGLD